MQYKDLNLKKIRDDNDLDFAHFTYQRGMCSCCYGPKSLPKRYWRDSVIPEHDDYTYILFKNADNGGGIVRGADKIKDYQAIEWRFPTDQLHKICKDLQGQLTQDYIVMVPPSSMYCIIVLSVYNTDSIERHKNDGYISILEV